MIYLKDKEGWIPGDPSSSAKVPSIPNSSQQWSAIVQGNRQEQRSYEALFLSLTTQTQRAHHYNHPSKTLFNRQHPSDSEPCRLVCSRAQQNRAFPQSCSLPAPLRHHFPFSGLHSLLLQVPNFSLYLANYLQPIYKLIHFNDFKKSSKRCSITEMRTISRGHTWRCCVFTGAIVVLQ